MLSTFGILTCEVLRCVKSEERMKVEYFLQGVKTMLAQATKHTLEVATRQSIILIMLQGYPWALPIG